MGGIPRARFLPSSVDDLIELAALQAAIQSGEMDRLDFPENCLDVVAQFLIGLVIINEIDIDEAFEIVSSAWNYRNFEYNDFIEVLDMLEEERRVWIDWEDNTYGKRGYSRMIYYTNIGTIAPDNSYLVFNAEGSILGQLSGSFVSNLRGGDVILLGGSTYRVTNIQGTRVNVSSVTGYRPTVPSWSGEARSRSRELSSSLLSLIRHCMIALTKGQDRDLFSAKHMGCPMPSRMRSLVTWKNTQLIHSKCLNQIEFLLNKSLEQAILLPDYDLPWPSLQHCIRIFHGRYC